MVAIPDANFRRGLGLMLTGLWVTIFGFAIVLLGGLAIAFGFTGISSEASFWHDATRS